MEQKITVDPIWNPATGWSDRWLPIVHLVKELSPEIDIDNVTQTLNALQHLLSRYGYHVRHLESDDVSEKLESIKTLRNVDLQWAFRFLSAVDQYFPSGEEANEFITFLLDEASGNQKFDYLSRMIRTAMHKRKEYR